MLLGQVSNNLPILLELWYSFIYTAAASCSCYLPWRKQRAIRENRLICLRLYVEHYSKKLALWQNIMPTIVSSDKNVTVALSHDAILELLGIFKGNVHISIKADKNTYDHNFRSQNKFLPLYSTVECNWTLTGLPRIEFKKLAGVLPVMRYKTGAHHDCPKQLGLTRNVKYTASFRKLPHNQRRYIPYRHLQQLPERKVIQFC